MSHEIEITEDGAAFFSARVPAWHKLGIVTPDALTAAEALKTAQLDWTVEKWPITCHRPDLPRHDALEALGIAGDKRFTLRDVSNFEMVRIGSRFAEGAEPMGAVVGTKYLPIQNAEAFALLDNIVDESGAHFETAGSLQGGRRVFMTMRLPEHMDCAGLGDRIETYLLATNSHDGWSSMTAAIVKKRVVCQNTLNIALGGAISTFRIRHTKSATERIEEARRVLGLSFSYNATFEAEMDRMLNKVYSESQFERLVKSLVPEPPKTAGDVTKRHAQEARDDMLGLWDSPTQRAITGTTWGALNAVIEYADWMSPAKGEKADDTRAIRVITGTNVALKQKAYDALAKVR